MSNFMDRSSPLRETRLDVNVISCMFVIIIISGFFCSLLIGIDSLQIKDNPTVTCDNQLVEWSLAFILLYSLLLISLIYGCFNSVSVHESELLPSHLVDPESRDRGTAGRVAVHNTVKFYVGINVVLIILLIVGVFLIFSESVINCPNDELRTPVGYAMIWILALTAFSAFVYVSRLRGVSNAFQSLDNPEDFQDDSAFHNDPNFRSHSSDSF